LCCGRTDQIEREPDKGKPVCYMAEGHLVEALEVLVMPIDDAWMTAIKAPWHVQLERKRRVVDCGYTTCTTTKTRELVVSSRAKLPSVSFCRLLWVSCAQARQENRRWQRVGRPKMLQAFY
jgi:hypothetical protein